MKGKKYLLSFTAIFVLFFSCKSPNGPAIPYDYDWSDMYVRPNYPTRKFWAQNLATDKFYQLEAEMLYENSACKVWAEKGSGVSETTALIVASRYGSDIKTPMMNTFGFNANIMYGGQIIARNTMQLADWLGDGDGKLCILFLDIKDNYKPGIDNSFCAGYFWPGDLYANDPEDPYLRYSNECDMIYLDTYPGKPETKNSYMSLAHEMQHLMNYVTNFVTGRTYQMDLWIDEGLSSAAEWVYTGSHNEERVLWYNQDPTNQIRRGNNFYVWGNRSSENSNAVLDDYATVYLFFQWLRLQAGNAGIYFDIIFSGNHDYSAVRQAVNSNISGMSSFSWENIMRTWHAANYINSSSGIYGYKNDPILKMIHATTAPAGVTSLNLFPGEGVYSVTPGSGSLPANSGNVKYAGLNKPSSLLSTVTSYSGGALLTFNVNPNIEGFWESGTTTGLASINTAPSPRSLTTVLSGPFPIGAKDVLKEIGFEKRPDLKLSMLDEGLYEQ